MGTSLIFNILSVAAQPLHVPSLSISFMHFGKLLARFCCVVLLVSLLFIHSTNLPEMTIDKYVLDWLHLIHTDGCNSSKFIPSQDSEQRVFMPKHDWAQNSTFLIALCPPLMDLSSDLLKPKKVYFTPSFSLHSKFFAGSPIPFSIAFDCKRSVKCHFNSNIKRQQDSLF